MKLFISQLLLSATLLFANASCTPVPVIQTDASTEKSDAIFVDAGSSEFVQLDADIPDNTVQSDSYVDTGLVSDHPAQDQLILADAQIIDAASSDSSVADTNFTPDAASSDLTVNDAFGIDAGPIDAGSCDAADPICQAQARYPDTWGLQDQALLEQLEILLKENQVRMDYDDESKDHLYGTGQGVGLDAVDGGIYCLYTGKVLDDDYNCEHTWPRSDFNERKPMMGDLHHLFAVDAVANNRRGYLHFGEVDGDAPNDWDWPDSCACEDDNLKACCSVAGDGLDVRVSKAFEPRDDAKGDIARALFYFAVRYRSREINMSRPADTGPAPQNRIPIYEEEALRRWHVSDPVSEKERIRQDRIDAIQHNRNPFIDCPEFVNKISDF